MKSAHSFLMLLTLALFQAPMANAQQDAYRLGVGDVIRIAVFGEDDLSVETRIGDGGTITFPFLGVQNVRGLTTRELEQRITNGLKPDYLIDPAVSVSITEYRDFFIYGEVNNPGGYAFAPGLTLRQAVALAGGFTERAARSRMTVIRDGQTSQPSVPIDLNDSVRPGDTITVDQSFF